MFTIHMFPDGQVQVVDQRQSAHVTRHVALEELVDAFRSQTVSSPTLPPGCLQYWRSSDGNIVALQKPAHRRTLQWGAVPYTMPLPAILFLFRTRQSEEGLTLVESAVFAMKGPWEGEDTPLYGFPYGNVFDDHTICWGDFEVTLSQFHHLDMVIEMFLDTPFNQDLNGHYENPGYEEQPLEEFWDALKDKESFPAERLMDVCLYRELPHTMHDEIFY